MSGHDDFNDEDEEIRRALDEKMGMARGQQRQLASRPIVEAQIMSLNDAFDKLNEPENLVIGDLVVEKDGIGWLDASYRTTAPMKFFRMLTNKQTDIDSAGAANIHFNTTEVDCIVLIVGNDGRVRELPHSTKHLTRYFPATKGSA